MFNESVAWAILDGFGAESVVVVRPRAVRLIGASCAILLGQFLYWSRKTRDEAGWFYPTRDDLEEQTGLSHRQQLTARKTLVEAGILEEERRGLPGKLHYRLHPQNLLLLLYPEFSNVSEVTANESKSEFDNKLQSVSSRGDTLASTRGDTLSHLPNKEYQISDETNHEINSSDDEQNQTQPETESERLLAALEIVSAENTKTLSSSVLGDLLQKGDAIKKGKRRDAIVRRTLGDGDLEWLRTSLGDNTFKLAQRFIREHGLSARKLRDKLTAKPILLKRFAVLEKATYEEMSLAANRRAGDGRQPWEKLSWWQLLDELERKPLPSTEHAANDLNDLRIRIRDAFRAGEGKDPVIKFLKEHCSPQEFDSLKGFLEELYGD